MDNAGVGEWEGDVTGPKFVGFRQLNFEEGREGESSNPRLMQSPPKRRSIHVRLRLYIINTI